MIFLYTPTKGPLAGRSCILEAKNDFHAEMLIDEATGWIPKTNELKVVHLGTLPLPTLEELTKQLQATAEADTF